MMKIRLLQPADVPAVLRVQAQGYSPIMQEPEEVVRARLRIAPDTAWVAEDNGGVCAYLMAYRSIVGKVTPLGGLFEVPPKPDCLYLHDLAVDPRCRGQGVGPALVRAACQWAEEQGLTHCALVSVQGSEHFWGRLGYGGWGGLAPAQRANLQTYAGPATYMVRRL